MEKAGRPKKKNAVKSGELRDNLCRFSFIADKKIVANIKSIAKLKGVTIKDYMDAVLRTFPDLNNRNSAKKSSVSSELKLQEYIKKVIDKDT